MNAISSLSLRLRTATWISAVLLASLLFSATLAFGQSDDEKEKAAEKAIRAKAAALKWQTGTVTLGDGLATLTLPPDYRYLDPAQTEILLHDIWGNPPGNTTLGAIVPTKDDVLADESYGVIITFEKDGYVSDKDAAKIDYNDLLKTMQENTRDANKERVEEGYSSMDLVGWAIPPSYDPVTHKMVWAKELEIGHAKRHGLNFDIRVLGRKGVLSLTAVSGMEQLGRIQREQPEILKMVDFNPGNRYADFNSSTDKVAEYGLAALVAGGIGAAAVKGGLFKGLWIAVLALKKFVIIGVVALVAGIKKLFGRGGGGGTA